MAKKRIRTNANPLSYPEPIKREQWISKFPYSKFICLDMGCGQGELIISSAKLNLDKTYTGIEVRQAMSNKVNNKIQEEKISNAICLQGNASISLNTMFKEGEVDEVIINFPDP